MKLTLSWLRDHLDTEASLEALAAKLSMIGLEVEGIDNPAKALGAFLIARVVEAKPHPNADKLRVAQVDTGAGIVEVVCGAPNCRTGMIGVFAPIGTYIPGTKITLDKRPVRGVVSNGMLVSERELEISDDHEGIIDLGEGQAKSIGKRYIDILGLDDPVIEVKLTPNRPDCTGVRGIARDLAACGLGKLKPERATPGVEGKYDCPIPIEVAASGDAQIACPAFFGRYIRGIKNGPSPAWMQARLKAVGQRPINAVVDVTNYVSLDRGRPLHVYDADKLSGTVRARFGKPGERFKGLDGREYAVDPSMCVIADDRAVLGFGGILGGEETGSTETTKNVLIECAYFDPLRTAATGRKASLQTDARYRFERGVDPLFLGPGLDLGTHLMLEIVGGEPSKARKAGAVPVKKTQISFAFERVKRLGGIDLPVKDMRTTLETLGFAVKGTGTTVEVTAPSWRPDVHGAADIVEEIVRIAGLDTVPSAPMPRLAGVAEAVLTERQKRLRRARRLLAARGMVEAVTWSFIKREEARRFGGGSDALELANPISADMSSMRPSLLPGLIGAAQRNRNRGISDVALFEIGQAFRGDQPEDQHFVAAGVRGGAARLVGQGRDWREPATDAGLFDVKADVVALLAGLGVDVAKIQVVREAPQWYHPGRSGAVKLGPKVVLAQFGELHPDTLHALDARAPLAAFEVFVDAVPQQRRKGTQRPAFLAQDLNPVRRDFAFIVDAGVSAGDLIKAASGADKKHVTDIGVFDLFEGAALGPGKKSIALEVTIQPRDHTLKDEEIEAIAGRIVAEVKRATGGEIRS